ncbi:tetratricopeptide repeat protein [Micromonospora mangrovi]|uniref:Tetratricopeptide repeat protein n=2 Tax=Micromonospora TaxID=1873 RepID=A0AAU8H5L0_9ACTN
MSSGFGELTVQAHHLVSAGDLAGAQRLLADALSDADPRPANASPELAEAAGLQARVLVALGEPHAARGWAAFAYAATSRLHGRSDERTVTAAATLAAVLHRVGSDARAARLYSDVIIELTARDGPESQRVLAAHADLATVEYARGQCEIARDRLQDAWELHREVYGDGHPAGIKMLARLGAMERDCGEFLASHEHLALAEELCRLHLAPDDPLAGQVAGLVRAAADPDHVCPAPEPPTRQPPIVPAARVPPADEGPPEPPPHRPAEPVAPHAAPSVPNPRLSEEDDDGYRNPTDDGWWPPEQTFDEAYRPEEAALPPSVVTLAGDQPDGVRRVGPAYSPEAASRLLPVPVHRPAPPPPDRGRWLPLVVGGVVVVLLGAAAVIAGVSRVDHSRDAPTTPRPSTTAASPGAAPPSGGAPASPGTPPGAVTLTDRRDNIALRWSYPTGGEGPVVVSGGRAGQDPHPFQQLPAGTTSWIVYGLDRTTDYCFTVAVVWSTDTVARSKPVCTRRR